MTEAATTPVVAASIAPTSIDGIGETAADRPEQLADRVEQVLRHPRTLQYQAHEGEERDGEQRVVVHDAAENPLRQRLEERRLEEPELDAEQAEDDAVGGEREGDGEAKQQEEDQRREDDRRHVGDQERGHFRSPPLP